MSCRQVHDYLDAYIDRELELGTSLELERHLAECADCRARTQQYREFQRSVRANFPHFAAPETVAANIRAQVRSAKAERPNIPIKRPLLSRQFWPLAAALAILLISGGLLFRTVGRAPGSEALSEQVVSSHIRSLMASHLIDVVSSDQHTVKPWFTGKLDFAPAVTDLSARGFALVGGRLDYIDNRPVAALVYKRRQHVINLFLWPSQDADSGARTNTIRGYNLVHGTRSHMAYWAVSDLNAAELNEFARDTK